MMTAFHAGFVNELVKEAGLRDVVKRIVNGRPIPKMGFFERRRAAKALGVKSKDVERILMQRQRRHRMSMGAIGVGGGLGGLELAKEADGQLLNAGEGMRSAVLRGKRDAGMQRDRNQNLLNRRDALMKTPPAKQPSAQIGTPPKPAAAAPKPAGSIASAAKNFGLLPKTKTTGIQ